MEITSSELAKRIPDFDDLLKLTDSIAELMVKKLLLEKEIKTLEAQTVLEVMTNPTYITGGKTPAMSLISSTWQYCGIHNELLPLRGKLAITIGELEKAKNRYSVFGEMLNIFTAVLYAEKKNLS